MVAFSFQAFISAANPLDTLAISCLRVTNVMPSVEKISYYSKQYHRNLIKPQKKSFYFADVCIHRAGSVYKYYNKTNNEMNKFIKLTKFHYIFCLDRVTVS